MSNNLKKRGGYYSYGIAEYNSKRYIRPYSDYRLAVLCSLNNKPIRDKMERYLLRSEYGSKY
jgi:hypothetical protein